MSNLRRTIPPLRDVCRRLGLQGTERGFHHSSPTAAAKRSPRVARAQSAPGVVRVRQNVSSGDLVNKAREIDSDNASLPPPALLREFHERNGLPFSTDQTVVFLQDYLSELESPSAKWERRLCQTHKITPHEMAILGSFLSQLPAPPQRSLGKKLLMSASAIGDASASFELVSTGLRFDKMASVEAPLRHVVTLAQTHNDTRAMILLGRVLCKQRGDEAGLEWFRKATNPPYGSLEVDGAAEALVLEGRILMKRKDTVGAQKAFAHAAMKLDDPVAYFYLSQLEPFGSPEQEKFLLKASMAGMLEAWHNLGSFELAKDQNTEIKSIKDLGMAREWFLLAANEGYGWSMLNLAMIHKAVGEMEEAFEWLGKAEKVSDVKEEAEGLRKQWDDEMGMEETKEERKKRRRS